ncbi:hypothetical protein [Streptomyces boluensis]|uniref:Uncharacterized protein n=1 Tax=Streptomyces boluensis TaxID=1775135 RepID=A0A964UK74_9ACTN|nr:hypothetical protein [Streptomyces boluensis]NBE50086.1 hypothetical protein [Streptomyces boluensis]
MSPAEGDGAKAENTAPQDGEQRNQEADGEGQEQHRQPAWSARRDLIAHGPDFISTLVERDQFGQTGGTHYGNTIFNFGARAEASRPASGPIPATELQALHQVFRECPSFDEARERLRTDRVVFLSGGRDSGRRSAALMLLHRLDIDRVRAIDADTPFSALPDQLDTPGGYVLCNLPVSRNRPLLEPQLLALHEQLENARAHLVITVEPSVSLGDTPFVRWEPPSTEDMLRAHVTHRIDAAAWPDLCGLPPVKEFLSRHQRPDEIREFAQKVVAYHRGEIGIEQLASYGHTAMAAQIARWLTGPEAELRDKAFLISLAVFDKSPYAVTAELSDSLFVRLQKTDDPGELPKVPVFGTSREERLQLARANGYVTAEATEWGPLNGTFCAAFRDERTARLLLTEVWNLHPSARIDLAAWLRKLAEDRRPLVRTRAASAAALLAHADLPSALAHLIEPWADSRNPNSWLTAANALTMAQLLASPDIPTVLRILHEWCIGGAESRRWTAIRGFGLLGPVHHEEALTALLDAIRAQSGASTDDEPDGKESARGKGRDKPTEADQQFADALELLLLAVREPVLRTLASRLPNDRRVRAHAVLAFLQACDQPADDSDRPAVLDWYAQAVESGDTATAEDLITFWRAALADRRVTTKALAILRRWVLAADRAPEAHYEPRLAALLTELASTLPDRRRITHLLRTTHGSDGEHSPVAQRLFALVTAA